MPLTETVAGAMAGVYQGSATPSQDYIITPPKKDEKLKTEQEWDYQTAKTGPQGEPLPPGAVGWKPDGEPDFGSGVTGWQNKTKYKLSTAWQKGWQEGARIADEAGYESDFMPRLVSAWNTTKSLGGVLAEPLLNALSVPAQALEQVGGSVGYALKDMIYNGKDLSEIDWKGNWEASRLAYNEVMRPFLGKSGELREEFVNRMNAGEDPEFIADSMLIEGKASPWIELGGQLIFDPLNALGKAGKVKQAAKFAKIAKEDMIIAETVEVADKLNDVLKIENKAQAIDKISDLRKTILETQDAASMSSAALAKPGLVSKNNVIKRMQELIKFTPDSRNQIVFNRASTMMESWMSTLGNNNAKMTDLLRSIADFRGADEAKSTAALINLLDSGVSPNMLFSAAGNDTMLIVERMMASHGDNLLAAFGKEAKLNKAVDAIKTQGVLIDAKKADKLGKLEKAQEGVSFEKNAQKMLEMMKSTTDELLPSAQKILEAEKAVKAGGEVSDQTKALAELAKQMKPYERKVANLHNMLQDNSRGPVKILNRLYAKIYLGISPGYAFRNMTQNRFQMWLDYGPSMIFGSGDDALMKAEKFHGSTLLAGEGFGATDPRGTMSKITTTDFWSGIKKWMTGGGEASKIGDTRLLAANDEAWASRKIVGTMYQKTFKEALEPMVNSVLKDKKFANLAPDVASSLKNALYENFGDVDAALASMKRKVALGMERPFTRWDKLPKSLQNYLGKVGVEERFIKEVLNAPSKDEAVAAANKIFDEIGQQGIASYADGIKPDLNNVVERAMNVALADGDVGMASVRATAAQVRVSSQTADALSQLVQRAAQESGVSAAVQGKYIAPITGWTKRRDEVNAVVDVAARIISDRSLDFAERWEQLRPILNLSADIPVPTTIDEFKNLAWANVRSYRSGAYNADMLSAMDNVEALLTETGQGKYLSELSELRKNFEAYQNVTIAEGGVLISEKPLVGTRPNIIRQIAAKYGYASVSETGAPLDKVLLNTINKYSGVEDEFKTLFKTLDDPIALDLVNRAFAKASKVDPIDLAKTFPAGEETILKLADSYGVAEQDILKYVNDSISNISVTIESGMGDSSPVAVIKRYQNTFNKVFPGINIKYRNEIFGDSKNIPAGLFVKSGGVGPEQIAQAFLEEGLITSDQVDNTDYIFELLRNNRQPTQTFRESFEYTKLSDVPEEVAKQAFEEAGYKTATPAKARKTGAVDLPENVLKVPNKEPSYSALIDMNNPEAAADFAKYADGGFSKVEQLTSVVDEEMFKNLSFTLKQKMGEVRAVSARVAMNHRDFTLLNYGEQTYAGAVAQYLFPYYKWYAGTYSNYAMRIMNNPAILGHYSMIKDRMAQAHADLPDWWKYNLSTDDFPEPVQKAVAGVEKFFGMEEQPLFLNIESLLWPLQGITGADFNDSEKVVNWWTFALDQMGKYGPTVWSPITMATGMKLIMDGEQEAGERWVGRLSSQTSTIKSVSAGLAETKFGKAIGIPTQGAEIDPLVNLFMGGVDPYERKRVRRAIGDMMLNNPDSEFQAQAIDAARSQSGQIWDDAVRQAGKDRMLGNVLSSMFGVGLKARTESDMQIDLFYSEYGKMMQMREAMSPEDFRNQMALLGEKYPFMDAVLIGSKSEEKRDAAFAYNVLSRVPPGDMSGLLEFVGVRQDSIDQFYENKGDLSKMSEDDRMRFNAGMLSLAAILKMPDLSTKQEWNTAKYQYEQAQKRAGFSDGNGNETELGEKLQTYYALMDDDRRMASQFLDMNPDLRQAMELKNAYIANNPTLNAYYGGIETIEKYYQSEVRSKMVAKYGEQIYQKWDYYNNIVDTKAKSAYLKENPDLMAFKEERGQWQEYVNRQTAAMASRMPDMKVPEFRQAQTKTQQSLQEMVGQGQRPVSSQELLSQMQPELQQMVQLYMQGQELPYSALQQLEFIGGNYGLTANEVLQVILSGQ